MLDDASHDTHALDSQATVNQTNDETPQTNELFVKPQQTPQPDRIDNDETPSTTNFTSLKQRKLFRKKQQKTRYFVIIDINNWVIVCFIKRFL